MTREIAFRILVLICIVTTSTFSNGIGLAEDAPANDVRFQKLFLEEAKRWEMWVGADRKRKAEILPEPVFRWQNFGRERGQLGAIYVWLLDGRPAVIGGIFSNPSGVNRRDVMHEFHALATDKLSPHLRDSQAKWAPTSGVAMTKLPDSPDVEETPAKRMLQLRAISRDFTAVSVDNENQRWQLRLLPKPLYRYEKPQGNVIDGAILAFLSDVGTDPEIILVLEARQDANGKAWYYRPIRLSISDLYVDYQAQRVWTSLRSEPDSTHANEDKTYLLHWDHHIEDFSGTPQK